MKKKTSPTLHDLARFYRDAGLVGEDRSAITSFIALSGGASVAVRGASGTGKTVLAEITVRKLLPGEPFVATVDMLSHLGIWSKGIVKRLMACVIAYMPEQQNAGDNDEVGKVLKKWGDERAAERAKSEDYGESTSLTRLEPRQFFTTAALTNSAHEKSWDPESARRVVKVATDPSIAATEGVLANQADVLVHGLENTRILSALERARIVKHAHRVMETTRNDIKDVRFFGAHEITAAIPKVFPETRSAFALYRKVLLGVARWYADDEVRVGDTVFLSPARAAEAWAFYGDILDENARKFEAADREILSVFPQPVWTGEAIAPECALEHTKLMRELKPLGLTDPALVKRQIAKLVMKGFLEETDAFSRKRWYRTDLADVANRVDWDAVRDACRKHAKEHLKGDELRAYLAKCDDPTMQNPLTGERGPISGDESVLYLDRATGKYAPVGKKRAAKPRGILAY